MKNPNTNKDITISTSGTAGPFIIVHNSLTDKVTNLLKENDVQYSIDKDAINEFSENADDVINLHGEPDLDAVQKLLDAIN